MLIIKGWCMIPGLMIKNIGEKPDLGDGVVLLDFWQYECNILSFGAMLKYVSAI